MVIKLKSWLKKLNPFRLLRWGLFRLGNWRRGRSKIDYISFTLSGGIPALPESRGWLRQRALGRPPLSLLELERIFERIAADPRPKGIILNLRGLALSLADLQTLRDSILRLRQSGKKVICFAHYYDNGSYYLASAADQIVLLPGGSLMTVGLQAQLSFLKDALDFAGVEFESIAISPYKTLYDQFARGDISPEARQQVEWLLDSQDAIIRQGIMQGRQLAAEAVTALIDTAPHTAEDAVKLGAVDLILTEEGLRRHLDTEHILLWSAADKALLKQWRKPSDKYIAVLPITGLMISGESGAPPIDIPLPIIGGERAGDMTITRQVRGLMKDKSAAAVILYIDSGGGDALAAESMTSALDELAQDRPLIVYMNRVAASGGYYVATPARWIVAQPGTITGSIGVLTGKIVTDGLWEKLRVKRVTVLRGANAALYSDSGGLTEPQRDKLYQGIRHTYNLFIGRVAAGRGLTLEQVDAVGGGRVWTGVQALEHKLVDELGGLRSAVSKARELANLPEETPLAIIEGKGKPLPAQIVGQADPAAALRYLSQNLYSVCSGLPQTLLPFDWHR